MLKEKDAKKIGIRACMDQIGYDFCKAHSDNAVSAWGKGENGKLNCFVGVNDTPSKQKDISEVTELVLTSGNDWKFFASCDVDMSDGSVLMLDFKKP